MAGWEDALLVSLIILVLVFLIAFLVYLSKYRDCENNPQKYLDLKNKSSFDSSPTYTPTYEGMTSRNTSNPLLDKYSTKMSNHKLREHLVGSAPSADTSYEEQLAKQLPADLEKNHCKFIQDRQKYMPMTASAMNLQENDIQYVKYTGFARRRPVDIDRSKNYSQQDLTTQDLINSSWAFDFGSLNKRDPIPSASL